MSVMVFTIRGESILLGFLKEFFSQEVLVNNLPNPFLYTNNRDKGKIYIGMSESDEINFPLPALIIQEGGFQENIQAIGSNTNFQNIDGSFIAYETPFFHPYTIHCIGRSKGEAKLLQAITAKCIIAFRKGIGEMGIDSISPIQGMPPQRMSSSDAQAPSQPYDCPISFQITMAQQFDVSRVEDPESEGVDSEYGVVFPVIHEETSLNITPDISGCK